MNGKLDEVYSWCQKSSKKIVIENKKLTIDNFEGKLVSRSFKLYEPIQKEFADFAKLTIDIKSRIYYVNLLNKD